MGNKIKLDKLDSYRNTYVEVVSDMRLTTAATLTLPNGVAISEFSTEGTLVGNSDNAVSTERAVKTYVDNQIGSVNNAGGVSYSPHGSIASTNVQDALNELADNAWRAGSAPTGGAIDEGDLWYDTTNNQMKVYRNSEWELFVLADALSGDFDTIAMDGGTF